MTVMRHNRSGRVTTSKCPICDQVGATATGGEPEQWHCSRCGRFRISGSARATLKPLSEIQRGSLSIGTRAVSDAGMSEQITVTTYWIDGQLAAPKPVLDLFEGADRLLLFLGDISASHFAEFTLDASGLYPALGFHTQRGLNDSMIALKRLGYVDQRAEHITLDGWKRIADLRTHRRDSRQAFVAMWFDDSMSGAWSEGFKKGIERTSRFSAQRIDELEHSGKIDDRIVAEIRRSGLVVADFTGNRGGVYFEAGFALGLSIPVIWSCRSDWLDRVHFDTRQYNHVVWDDPADLADKLYWRILAVIGVNRPGAPDSMD